MCSLSTSTSYHGCSVLMRREPFATTRHRGIAQVDVNAVPFSNWRAAVPFEKLAPTVSAYSATVGAVQYVLGVT